MWIAHHPAETVSLISGIVATLAAMRPLLSRRVSWRAYLAGLRAASWQPRSILWALRFYRPRMPLPAGIQIKTIHVMVYGLPSWRR